MICPRCAYDNVPGEDACRRCLCDLTSLDRPLPQDRVEHSLMTDSVAVLQPRTPATVPIGASVAQAVQILLDEDIGAVLVVDDDGCLAGIFSERDMLTRIAGEESPLSQLQVERFMTIKPQTVSPDDKLAFALHKMDVGGYRHLPVVRDRKPVGIISVRDLIRHMMTLSGQGP